MVKNPKNRAPVAEPSATVPRKAAKATRGAALVEPNRGKLSRDRILSVATSLFAEYGFAAMSIRDIATACGVSIPSIYHFFTDKDTLYAVCCEAGFRRTAERLNRALQEHEPGRERILAFITELCDVLLNDHDFRRLLQRELLREERRGIEELTTHHFTKEFALLNAEIEHLTGKGGTMDHTFALYALVFGLTQLRRISEVAGSDPALSSDPQRLARYVLSVVLPKQRW